MSAIDRPVYVVLLHSPMVDRSGREVTTAVTNLDIHDIARSCKTYGIAKYFIVNPEPEQEKLVKVIVGHWKEEVSRVHHPSRAKALDLVRFARTFEEAYNEATFDAGEFYAGITSAKSQVSRPFVVMPDARDLSQYGRAWSYEELRSRWESGAAPIGERPLMIIFGTGWGISPTFFGKVDQLLRPIQKAESLALEATKSETVAGSGKRRYNHLSVRAAAAIVLDRLFGER